MDNHTIFLLQLLGFVGTGGFIGEFYRATYSGGGFDKYFMANFLAGSFLSFVIAYTFYATTQQRVVSLLLGGLLSYQDEKQISKTSRSFILKLLGGMDTDEKDNDDKKS